MKRAFCQRCQRPSSHCLCPWLPLQPQASRTRIIVLQHPDETNHPLNTARFLPSGLANCELWVGETFPQLEQWVAHPEYQSAVLFPHDDAISPVQAANTSRPWQIFVPDGTWRKSKRLMHLNPTLAELPHMSLPEGHSAYIFRHSKVPNSHSTLEAATMALNALENSIDTATLLAPLHRLMADQKTAMGEAIFAQHYGEKHSEN